MCGRLPGGVGAHFCACVAVRLAATEPPRVGPGTYWVYSLGWPSVPAVPACSGLHVSLRPRLLPLGLGWHRPSANGPRGGAHGAPGPAPHLPGVRNARGKWTFIEHLLGAGAGSGRARQTQARSVQEKGARCFRARLQGRRLHRLRCEAGAVGTPRPGAPGLPRPWSESTVEAAGRGAGIGQQAVQPQAGGAASGSGGR